MVYKPNYVPKHKDKLVRIAAYNIAMFQKIRETFNVGYKDMALANFSKRDVNECSLLNFEREHAAQYQIYVENYSRQNFPAMWSDDFVRLQQLREYQRNEYDRNKKVRRELLSDDISEKFMAVREAAEKCERYATSPASLCVAGGQYQASLVSKLIAGENLLRRESKMLKKLRDDVGKKDGRESLMSYVRQGLEGQSLSRHFPESCVARVKSNATIRRAKLMSDQTQLAAKALEMAAGLLLTVLENPSNNWFDGTYNYFKFKYRQLRHMIRGQKFVEAYWIEDLLERIIPTLYVAKASIQIFARGETDNFRSALTLPKTDFDWKEFIRFATTSNPKRKKELSYTATLNITTINNEKKKKTISPTETVMGFMLRGYGMDSYVLNDALHESIVALINIMNTDKLHRMFEANNPEIYKAYLNQVENFAVTNDIGSNPIGVNRFGFNSISKDREDVQYDGTTSENPFDDITSKKPTTMFQIGSYASGIYNMIISKSLFSLAGMATLAFTLYKVYSFLNPRPAEKQSENPNPQVINAQNHLQTMLIQHFTAYTVQKRIDGFKTREEYLMIEPFYELLNARYDDSIASYALLNENQRENFWHIIMFKLNGADFKVTADVFDDFEKVMQSVGPDGNIIVECAHDTSFSVTGAMILSQTLIETLANVRERVKKAWMAPSASVSSPSTELLFRDPKLRPLFARLCAAVYKKARLSTSESNRTVDLRGQLRRVNLEVYTMVREIARLNKLDFVTSAESIEI